MVDICRAAKRQGKYLALFTDTEVNNCFSMYQTSGKPATNTLRIKGMQDSHGRHLHQRIEEHKGSAIGRHIKEQHGKEPDNIEKNFKILRKCQSKLDCLIFEMFFIRLLKPKLNKQSDSLRAKLFI